MRQLVFIACGCLVALGASAAPAEARVLLAHVFSQHMVLQRDEPIRIWGTANPGEKIELKLGKETQHATATADGHWLVQFPAMPAGGPYTLAVVGTEPVQLKDVMVGDVFLCIGQSNMGRSVAQSTHTEQDVANSADPLLRIFVVDISLTNKKEPLTGRWQLADPHIVNEFAAVPYFLARELRRQEKIPIGMLQCPYASSQIRAWINQSDLAGFPTEPRNTQLLDPSVLYNAIVAPLAGIGIKAFVWYQGESDFLNPQIYPRLFSVLVKELRDVWKRGPIPVFFVELPNFGEKCNRPSDSAIAEFREAQSKGTAIAQCFMAVSYDSSTESNVPLHPLSKKTIAYRLSLLIRNHIYHEKIAADAPIPTVQIKDGAAKVVFPSDTAFKPIKDNLVSGFELAGADNVFHSATATLRGSEITVTSPAVPQPKYLRFAWADNPSANLYTTSGLPINSFRTDTIPPRSNYVATPSKAPKH